MNGQSVTAKERMGQTMKRKRHEAEAERVLKKVNVNIPTRNSTVRLQHIESKQRGHRTVDFDFYVLLCGNNALKQKTSLIHGLQCTT
jgi:hypothetical protein